MNKHVLGVGGLVGLFGLVLFFKPRKVSAKAVEQVQDDDVDVGERVKQALKERASKAGKASGEARRKKKAKDSTQSVDG